MWKLAQVWLIVTALAAGLFSCSSEDPKAEAVGDVALAAAIAPGVDATSVHYRITGNGITPLEGDIPLDAGATPSILVGGLPAGTGYLVELSLTSTDGLTHCAGSAQFAVVVNQTTAVQVDLLCRGPDNSGRANVGATVRNCPNIGLYSAAPRAVGVGGRIFLNGSATSPDGRPLTYLWSAAVGTIQNASSPSAIYTCTDPGNIRITFAVSDAFCSVDASFFVECRPFCSFHPDGTTCDDGNACTQADRCAAGECVGSNPLVCTASDQCHVAGACNPANGTCSNPEAPNGTACALPHAVASCTGGACGIDSCLGGFGNCDTQPNDGCEVSLLDTPANCGACGRACILGQSCTSGLCLSPPPTGVTATAGGFSVRVSWTAAPGAGAYEVSRGASSAGPFTALGTFPDTVFFDESVAGSTSYYYAIKSISEAGPSVASTAAGATTLVKQVCVTSNTQVRAFGASQSGSATPLRTITGNPSFGFVGAIASNLRTNELFVITRTTGLVTVFGLGAQGSTPPMRTLSGAGAGANFMALFVDPIASEVVTGDYGVGTRVDVLDAQAGGLKRSLQGAATSLMRLSAFALDRAHSELFAGQTDTGGAFQQLFTFGSSAQGNTAPLRMLGTPATPAGSWALAFDAAHGELLAASGANSVIQVFDRHAFDGQPPLRTIAITGLAQVYDLLLDLGDDAIWVVGLDTNLRYALFRIPRGSSGSIAIPPTTILFTTPGRLARCN